MYMYRYITCIEIIYTEQLSSWQDMLFVKALKEKKTLIIHCTVILI